MEWMVDDILESVDTSRPYLHQPCGIGDLVLSLRLVDPSSRAVFIVQKQYQPVLDVLRDDSKRCIVVNQHREEIVHTIESSGLQAEDMQPGKIWLCHPSKCPSSHAMPLQLAPDFVTWYRDYFSHARVPMSLVDPYSFNYPVQEIPKPLVEKLNRHGVEDVSNTIIVYPLANSIPSISPSQIEILCNTLEEVTRCQVFTNVMTSSRAKSLDLELSESIILAPHVKKIVSLRSGICDLFQALGQKLVVLNPVAVYSINNAVGFQKVLELPWSYDGQQILNLVSPISSQISI